jgi:uncharacterized membrane protein
MNVNINSKELGAFVTATGTAVAAGFVAFGHSSLASPAQAAFVAVAGLVVAIIHNGLLKTSAASKSPTV